MSEYIDPAKIEEFKALQVEGKRLASIGDLPESLKKFELAKAICPTAKVLQRIEKIKVHLQAADVQFSRTQSISHNSSSLSCLSKSDTSAVKCNAEKVQGGLKTYTNANTNESSILNDIQNIQDQRKISSKSSESSELSPLSLIKFKRVKKEAKQLAYAGRYNDALRSFKEALNIFDCPNVRRYVKEIESVISNDTKNTEEPVDQSAEIENHHTSKSIRESPKEGVSVTSSNSDSNGVEQTSFIHHTFPEKKLPSDSVEVLHQESSPVHDEEASERETERKLSEIKNLYDEARELAAEGKLTDALKFLRKAQSIHATEKVQKRIDKLEALVTEDSGDTEDDKMISIANGFSVFHEIYNNLYPYQREGVAWMWKLYQMGKGGVLGDDMGLGKTFQIIAFISGMIDAELVKHVLIIMPVSLLKNWEKEFKKWCPGIAVHDFHSGSKKERERNLLRVQRRGHVLLTSYGMIVNNINTLNEMEGREYVWDYVILDEGHKIKNPTKTTKAVYEIPAKNRLVLTGTPIQNNLRELWSLYDFVHQGTLLGSLKTFKLQYENPITRSREKDATAGEKRLGLEIAENLKALIKPYFLRRTKDEIWKKEDKDINQLEKQMENMKITGVTTKKNDLILWTYMSEPQIAIYTDFLHSEAVKAILVSKRSPLVELTTLKKICDHPRLLSQRACSHLGLNGDLEKDDLLNIDDESTMASSIDNVTDDCLLKESGKLNLVIKLLENLKETGHRTLVFSLSRKILDMIHRILINRKWKVMRLDGTITKTDERERRIMKFQRDSSYPVFLLTTQVGGVGITLTAADRVIIYDPSWNPATDSQAVDRVYRIGQEKDVVVYRLITCGTVEEKIYRRQIFKDSITRQATGAADPYRYFSKQELRELFSLENPHYSATQVQLHEMHSSQRNSYDELERHLNFLRTLDIFGISDHDLMFSKEVVDHTEDNDSGAITDHFIKQKVAAAHELIKMEASVVAEGIRLAGTYSRPYQETIPLAPKKSAKDAYKPPVLPEIVDLTEDAKSDIFSSNENREAPSNPMETADHDIQQISPNKKNEDDFSSNLKLSLTKSEKESEDVREHSFSTTPVTIVNISDDEVSLESQPFPDKSEKITNFDVIRKIEKLRKSISHDEEVTNPADEIALNVTTLKDTSVRLDDDDIEVSAHIEPLDLTSRLQKTFQANLTHFMNEDLADISLDEENPNVTLKKGRKSCARQSAMFISDSDTSYPNSASNSRSSVNLSNEVVETFSEPEDSPNISSCSFVPDSSPSTPQTPISYKAQRTSLCESYHQSVMETPPVSLRIKPELLPDVSADNSVLSKLDGSVRRITPLKINKSLTHEDSPFAQAMATSLIITPEPSPKAENIHKTDGAANVSCRYDDGDDSPIKVIRKKKARQVVCDSEESDDDIIVDDGNNDTKQSDREHSELSSDEEQKDGSDSENDPNEESASSGDDDEEAISDHSAVLSSGSDNEIDDLEQTFATCKEKDDSSEEDSFSEDSDDDSGSVFSEDL